MSYQGQRTCPKCGWDMVEIKPGDPPMWVSMWVCECRYAEVVTLGCVESLMVNIGISKP